MFKNLPPLPSEAPPPPPLQAHPLSSDSLHAQQSPLYTPPPPLHAQQSCKEPSS